MRVAEAKQRFRDFVANYFLGAVVIFTQQSRIAKMDAPLITITTGNVKRVQHPAYKVVDGVLVGGYPSRLSITIDLFTKGKPVVNCNNGTVVAYENTAMEDMLCFADFLGSPYAIEWCHTNDVAIAIEGDVQDLTALVNDNNYDYRSRLNVMFYFTQYAIGSSAVLSEDSLLFPTGETDSTGQPQYSPDKPASTTSNTGTYAGINDNDNAIIEPVFEVNSSGGGTEELAEDEVGYFTEVEIKEDTDNE